MVRLSENGTSFVLCCFYCNAKKFDKIDSFSEHLLNKHFCCTCISEFTSERLHRLHWKVKHGLDGTHVISCSAEITAKLTRCIERLLNHKQDDWFSNEDQFQKFLMNVWMDFVETSLNQRNRRNARTSISGGAFSTLPSTTLTQSASSNGDFTEMPVLPVMEKTFHVVPANESPPPVDVNIDDVADVVDIKMEVTYEDVIEDLASEYKTSIDESFQQVDQENCQIAQEISPKKRANRRQSSAPELPLGCNDLQENSQIAEKVILTDPPIRRARGRRPRLRKENSQTTVGENVARDSPVVRTKRRPRQSHRRRSEVDLPLAILVGSKNRKKGAAKSDDDESEKRKNRLGGAPKKRRNRDTERVCNVASKMVAAKTKTSSSPTRPIVEAPKKDRKIGLLPKVHASDTVTKAQLKRDRSKFPCNICGTPMTTNNFTTHAVSHLPEETDIAWLYKCLLCKGSYVSLYPYVIRSHLEIAHRAQHKNVEFKNGVHFIDRKADVADEIAKLRLLAFPRAVRKEQTLTTGKCKLCECTVVGTQNKRFHAITKHLKAVTGFDWLYKCAMCEFFKTDLLMQLRNHMNKMHKKQGGALLVNIDYIEIDSIDEIIAQLLSKTFTDDK